MQFYPFTIVGTCFISARLSFAQTAKETPKEIPFVNTKNSFSEIAKQILQKTESIEVLSLDPSEEKAKTKEQGFYQYKVLGSTIVKEKDIKLKLTEGINKGVRESHMSEIGLCFIPRHGLRAKREGKTLDLVICFQCWRIDVYIDSKFDKRLATNRKSQETLDEILRMAKVPLPPKPPKDK